MTKESAKQHDGFSAGGNEEIATIVTNHPPDWECVQWLKEIRRTGAFPISDRTYSDYLDRIIKDLEKHYGI